MEIGQFIKACRMEKLKTDKAFSLRAVAKAAKMSAAHLSKVEAGKDALSEEMIERLAKILKIDSDVLLAIGGKISPELQQIIAKRPDVFGHVLSELKKMKDAPDHAVLRIVRVVRDGNW